MQALLRAFPPGGTTPNWPWCARWVTWSRGAWTRRPPTWRSPRRMSRRRRPGRQRRLQVAVASLQLSLARWRGDLAGVIEQARLLASPISGQSDEDSALGSDLRVVALMNLGTLEAWSLGLPDAERHLQEGADLARRIGRPYLEVGCLAQLGFASKIRSFATTGSAATRRSRWPSGTAGAPSR